MKRYFYLCLMLGLAFGLIVNTQAFAASALYDDFSGTYIDGQKWNERELVREVVGGQLVSKVRNSTTNINANNLTSFQNPSSINIIQCDITVVATNLDTGTNVYSAARLDGYFYNNSNSGTQLGNIWAGIFIGDRGNGIEAWWLVTESQDDQGWTWIDIGTGTLSVPGLAYGNSYTTKIEYDGTNGFTFTVAGVSDSFAGPARQDVAANPFKALRTRAYSFDGSGTGYVSALFDNVFVNNAPYDDFSEATLDRTKWLQNEAAREIANGKLRLNWQGFDSTNQISLTLVPDDTPYLEAKVRIETGSQVSIGATGVARIAGYYYNDSRGPGSPLDYNQYEGDVFVQVRLLLDGNGDLKANALVDRSNSPDQSSFTTLFSQDFTTPINFDTDYTLSIEFTDSMLTFKCNDETLSYEITTPVYTAFAENNRALRSRLYLAPGQSGYIKAQFDDVYVEQATYDASGEWDFSTSNTYASGGCDPDDPSTGTVTVTQTGTNVTMVVHDEYGDTTFDGIVSDDTYYLTTTDIEDDRTQTINIILTLSSDTSGVGEVTYTETKGFVTCDGGMDIAFTKQAEQAEQPVGGDSGGNCFIATAAYGSLMEPHVKILRNFRDEILLNSSLGKGFVKAYYRYSPPIADFISKHDNLRAVVRISLLPIVGISWVALKIGPVLTVALMLFFISCFIGIVWLRRRYKE
jgi:hypothetical protein